MDELPKLEHLVKGLDVMISQVATDYEKMQSLMAEREETQSQMMPLPNDGWNWKNAYNSRIMRFINTCYAKELQVLLLIKYTMYSIISSINDNNVT